MPKKINVDMEKFWEAYHEGLTERAMAKKLGITLKVIIRVFREQKLEPRPKIKDLKNSKIGKLEIIERDGLNKFGTVIWKCKCDCDGKIIYVLSSNLINGTTKSCGCCFEDRYGKKKIIREKYQEMSGSYLSTIEKNARKRNLEYNITLNYIWELFLKQERKCALSGMDLKFEYKKQTASLDRIDSSKGYIEGNVQWLHKDINRLKNNYSEKQLIDWSYKIIHNQSKNNFITSDFLLY